MIGPWASDVQASDALNRKPQTHKHWLDWQRDHEIWTFLWYLDLMEGNTDPRWWCDQPESVSGWTCRW